MAVYNFTIDDATEAALERWLDSDYNIRMQHRPDGEVRRTRILPTVQDAITETMNREVGRMVQQAPPSPDVQALLDQKAEIEKQIQDRLRPDIKGPASERIP